MGRLWTSLRCEVKRGLKQQPPGERRRSGGRVQTAVHG